MNIGAEPKKVAILAGLILVGAYTFYSNVLSEPSAPESPTQTSRATGRVAEPPSPLPAVSVARGPIRRVSVRSRDSSAFHPSMKLNPDEKIDPMSIDPTLRLDLLAKVESVKLEGGARNLFQFSTPPPPPAPKAPKIVPKSPLQIAQEEAQKKEKAEAVKPPPPPIHLKYYGYTSLRVDGTKRAFFLDGENIYVAGEGDLIERRYKVVRIGVNSVVMEDTQSKHQQTLPLVPEAVG